MIVYRPHATPFFVPYVNLEGGVGYCRCAHPDWAHIPTMSEELELGEDNFKKILNVKANVKPTEVYFTL